MILHIHDQTCHLLSERAVYWKEKKTLILADIHLGKDTTFRKSGIPVPSGIMEDDLSVLMHLLLSWDVEKCIIVGDLIHSSKGITVDVIHKFGNWLKSLSCEVHLVLGNHDYALIKNLPPDWPIHLHQEGWLIEPFYFSHFPIRHAKWFVWAGHVHPKIMIKDHHDQLVLRCFQLFDDLAILPAFSFFVGGTFVKKTKQCKIYAIADTSVIEI